MPAAARSSLPWRQTVRRYSRPESGIACSNPSSSKLWTSSLTPADPEIKSVAAADSPPIAAAIVVRGNFRMPKRSVLGPPHAIQDRRFLREITVSRGCSWRRHFLAIRSSRPASSNDVSPALATSARQTDADREHTISSAGYFETVAEATSPPRRQGGISRSWQAISRLETASLVSVPRSDGVRPLHHDDRRRASLLAQRGENARMKRSLYSRRTAPEMRSPRVSDNTSLIRSHQDDRSLATRTVDQR